MNLFWVVGESSGDHHAAHLIEELNRVAPEWTHAGMGGESMQAQGCELVAHLSEISMMGLTEVIGHLPRLLKLQARLVEEIEKRNIDLVVFVDLPDFNLPLGSRIRKKFGNEKKLFYYVSPQVWAWRKGRAKGIAKLVDAMAVLFPFETEVYKKFGLETVYFGHPLAGVVKPSATPDILRKQFGLEEGEEAVAVLPGSREHEVERHLPVQLEAIRELRKARSEKVKTLLVRADTVPRAALESMTAGMDNLEIVEGGAYDALTVAKVGLIKSGTSTVEASLIGTPFVVLYKVSALSYRLARLLVRGVKHIAMVNVLAGREIVKERIQHEATGSILAGDLLKIWEGPERERVASDLKTVADSLGEPGATKRLAEWIVQRFGGE